MNSANGHLYFSTPVHFGNFVSPIDVACKRGYTHQVCFFKFKGTKIFIGYFNSFENQSNGFNVLITNLGPAIEKKDEQIGAFI